MYECSCVQDGTLLQKTNLHAIGMDRSLNAYETLTKSNAVRTIRMKVEQFIFSNDRMVHWCRWKRIYILYGDREFRGGPSGLH